MVTKKVAERMVHALKRLLPIIQNQRSRDVSEADTVTLVKDTLSEVLGYDKYQDLTGEFVIRGTFCDLAIKLDGKLAVLLEVKAIGITLNEKHLKQAVDYAANHGTEWVILTNSVVWRLYHVIFAKPIDKQLVAEIDITALDTRKEDDLDKLFLFSKEGFKKGAHIALRDKQDALNRFVLSAVLLHNEVVKNVIRRELRRVAEINVAEEEIFQLLRDQVIKRDNLDGPQAEDAAKKVKKASKRALRSESVRITGALPIGPMTDDENGDSADEENDPDNNASDLEAQEGELAGAGGNES